MGPPSYARGSFLGRLPLAVHDELVAAGATRPLPSGHILMREGLLDTHVELIRRGYAKITLARSGQEWLLAIRMAGDLVGEFAAVSGQARSATVTACGDLVSTVVGRAAFVGFLGRHPAAATGLTTAVGERLRWSNMRRVDIAAFPVQQRLARVIAEIAAGCGAPGAEGVGIQVALSQTELAAMIGSAEDTVQRALRGLRRDGFIQTGYRTITVLDTARLDRYAAQDPSA